MANTSDSLSVLKSLTPLGTVTTSAASSLLTVKSSKAISCKKSSLATAQLIRRYHTLNKELSKCLARIESSKANDNSSSHGHSQNYSQQDTAADLARITEIRQEMDDLGGLDMYQKASTLGQSKQRGGDSSKWLVPILESHYLQLNKKPGLPLRLLDIGALSPYNYQKYSSWIQTTPIDLNPQDPLIAKMDFLEMPIPTDREHLFDVVCLSLVINFVGDPKQRGEILRRSTYFLMPGTGILYLVLPLPCIQNSRYMDHGLLVEMMQALGYTSLLKYHFARKLAYYAFKLDAAVAAPKNKHKAHRSSENVAHPLFPKKLRHDKPNRNK
ncbi:putative methyltransferase-domain-containing protein [Lobosporangium transversale]|uniref:25S rRNA adenine-N(1) methyltransferase n=1 Tax=Lobosporangium transversale TaxID=64571 RepID=A0A1Y2GIX2_9FUNG|nr:putative methyltransferase-domain-containing protein [Lobosporangium transversale]ORZ12136.1 putative methyltransferase-domain-containing protein [Lobosporangium transversale]|eukprot:XP_021880001.1 putative methyltransferase-domain-containing protein [Lobosporangium transversale]